LPAATERSQELDELFQKVRRGELMEGDVSAQITPEGTGYMPLYCAAHWIATKGSTLQIDPLDLEVWKSPFSQLLSRISSDEVAVTGLRKGQRKKIEGHIFAGIAVDYPFADTPVASDGVEVRRVAALAFFIARKREQHHPVGDEDRGSRAAKLHASG